MGILDIMSCIVSILVGLVTLTEKGKPYINRSIQTEGTFGIIKYDRWYKRIVRNGLDCVRLELFLVSIGHNLYKFHNKQMRLTEAA